MKVSKGGRSSGYPASNHTRALMDRLIGMWIFAGFVLAAGIVLIGIGTAFLATSADGTICTDPANSYAVELDTKYLRLTYRKSTNQQPLLSVLMGQTPAGDGPLASYPRVVDACDDGSRVCATVSYTVDEDQVPLKLSVKELSARGDHDVTCFETSWTSDSDDIAPTDCFAMTDFWFGGAEMYYQDWPINSWNKHMSFYLSGDMFSDPQQYGSVLERYWLSSQGVALYVHPDVPLHVSIEKQQICFKGECINLGDRSYVSRSKPLQVCETARIKLPKRLSQSEDKYPHNQSIVARAYEEPYKIRNSLHSTHWLTYTTCIGKTPQSVHHFMFDSFFDRPKTTPNVRMLESPIWSTWARYKVDINESVILEYANEILKYGFSNSQIEIDDGYEAHYGDHTFDPSKFPDAAGMIDTLHDLGFRVTTWVTPFINPRSKNYNHADTNKLFVQNGNTNESGRVTWWNGIGSSLDFTNFETCNWYENALDEIRTRYGVTSFKFDAGEINYVTAVPNFKTHESVENLGSYTQDYAECAAKLGGDIEVRSAWNCQHLPIFVRMMDKDSNWGPAKGLKTLIPTALTFSLLGYPYILPDMIGGNAYEEGLHGKPLPDRELFIRWLELTAFLPAMQFSYAPWQYDDVTIQIARDFVELHRTIVTDEVIKSSLDYTSRKSGIGPIRPIWWASVGDTRAFAVDDEFMLGDSYLVAPIIVNGSRSRDIYLPGPMYKDGTSRIVWKDKLGKHSPVLGGTVVQDYRIELEEISWWELSLS